MPLLIALALATLAVLWFQGRREERKPDPRWNQ